MKIWGIHYNWHTHPTVGEVYHHFYLGETYDAPDQFHKAEVIHMEKLEGGIIRVCFDNGTDFEQGNINKVMIIPNDFEQEKDDTGSSGRTDQT